MNITPESATKAVSIARKLSPAMRKAMLSVVQADNRRSIDPDTRAGTACALLERGLITDRRHHWHQATELGAVVVAVLLVGEERVLEHAAQQAQPKADTMPRPWPKTARAAASIISLLLEDAKLSGWVNTGTGLGVTAPYQVYVHVGAGHDPKAVVDAIRARIPYNGGTVHHRETRGTLGSVVTITPGDRSEA